MFAILLGHHLMHGSGSPYSVTISVTLLPINKAWQVS
jgi:hypothetical protein